MSATLSREYMATHSYKGQKAKPGAVKPKMDPDYAKSLIREFILYTGSIRIASEVSDPICLFVILSFCHGSILQITLFSLSVQSK